MKYKTLEYNMNYPCLKKVIEPLESTYGLAIKVWKDNSIVDSSISVGGLSATSTRNGWQLFELSSGSSVGRVEYDVKAVKEASVHADILETCLSGNSTSRDKTSNLFPWNLYNTSLSGKTLYAKDVKNYETCAVISTATEVSSTVVPFESTGIKFGTDVYYPVDGMWCIRLGTDYIPSSESMEVSSDVLARAQLKMPAHSDISIFLNLKVDSGDGFDGNFKLAVVHEDNNTIEMK